MPAPPAQAAEVDEAITFHGSVEQSHRSDWNTVQLYGIYNFSIDGSGPQAEGLIASTRTTGGGFYYDGSYYCVSGTRTALKVRNNWIRFDAETWERIDSRYYESPTLTDSQALAYDYISGKAYASGLNLNNQETPYELRTVDMATGEMTNVGKLENCFSAMAFDSEGQLWGIAHELPFPYKAKLYKIDKNTAAETLVGELGINQKGPLAAACFDHRNGKLYWAGQSFTYNEHLEESYVAGLYEIDLSTGQATLVKTFPEREIFASLYIVDSHPKAPEAVKELAFRYAQGSTTQGNASFRMPENAYDRTPLSGSLKAEIYVDDQLVDTKTGLNPGATVESASITLDEGKHKLKVYCYNSADNKSVVAAINIYGGNDVPAPVTDLQCTLDPHATTATITWQAPESGTNGGYLDPSTLTYKVVRRPDKKTVAEGLTECKYTDVTDRTQELTQYEVIAVTPDGQSASTYTTPMIIGQPRTFPYIETFDSRTAFNRFTVYDPRGIGGSEGDMWMYYPDRKCAVYWLNYNAFNSVDGWLVTPSLDFKENYAYRISWDTERYSTDVDEENTFAVRAGEFPTIESMTNVVADITYHLDNKEVRTFSTLYVASKGDRHIGFHAIGSPYDHVPLDNLRIQEYGPSSIPAAPELVAIGPNEQGGVDVEVKLPTKDIIGNESTPITALRLYTGDRRRLVARTDVEPGSVTAVITDPAPIYGLNSYIVTAGNESGFGLDLEVSVNLRPDVPKAVENLSVQTLSDGRDAHLTWSYPADMLGMDGNVLTPEQITYDIYRQQNMESTLVASVNGETSIVLDNVLDAYPEERQKSLTFEVVPRTEGGIGQGKKASALFGAAYELPINEIFDTETMMQPWDNSRSIRSAFYTVTRGYDPMCDPVEGGILSFQPSNDGGALGIYISPRINFTGLLNPKLSFTIFHSTLEKLAGATIQFGVIVEKDGVEQEIELIPGIYNVQGTEDGWKTYDIDMAKYADCERASIVIRCMSNYRRANVHLDNIRITGDKPAIDARIASVTGAKNVLMGHVNTYYVTVHNNGTNDLENVVVNFKAGDEVLDTRTINLNADESLALEFAYTPALDAEEQKVVLSATAEVEGDANRFNNYADMRVMVEMPNLPYVNDLNGYTDADGHIHLFWSDATLYPKETPVVDNFDSYDDFLIDNIGSWTLNDMDKGTTMLGISSSMGTFEWPHAGEPQAYIVFNPVQVGVGALCTPRSGSRCLVSFPSAAGNNDWLISPALSGHAQTINFYARCMLGTSPELFSVMVSYQGTDPADFVPLRENVTLNSEAWAKFSYELPAGVRHFAIVCKSSDGFGFMVDDVEYVPQQPEVELTGYNVYRQGKLLADGLGETEYVDSDINADELYRYNVTATYTDGESIFSNPFEVQASFVSALTGSDAFIYAHAGQIVVKAPAGSAVSVHSVDGRCFYSFTASGTHALRVPAGIYVVRAADATAKVIVK